LSTFDHDDFAGADRTDLNPDLKVAGIVHPNLAKMWDAAERGDDIRKTPRDREQYEQYGRVVVMSDLKAPLRDHIPDLHRLRKRTALETWEKMTETREYAAVIKAVATAPGLSLIA
jgi:hypothetical protein